MIMRESPFWFWARGLMVLLLFSLLARAKEVLSI